MAGRGRGRGGRGSSITAISDALGLGRGELSGLSVHQPPPLYPTLEFKPLPFPPSDRDGNKKLIKLKQAFRQSARSHPYFIRRASTKKEIDRYTDRYLCKEKTSDDSITWKPQWKRFPAELKLKVCTPGARGAARTFRPKVKGARKNKNIDFSKQLEILEAEEKENEEEGQDELEEEEEEEEIYEEDPEETDYNQTYFDPGDDYGNDEDDALEEAIY